MSYASAIEAVKAYIRETWTATTVVMEGERFERPDPPAPFLLVEIDGGSGRPYAIGSRGDYRHQGMMVLTAFVPQEQATMALDMAERAAGMLAQRTFEEHGARLWAPSFDKLRPAEGDSGWLALEVSLPLWVDVVYDAA